MKGLLAKSATALFGISLILLVVQGVGSAPGDVTASAKAPSAATVAAARAHFNKVLGSHAPAIGGGGGSWVSPGKEHFEGSQPSNGTVTEAQSVNWSGYADIETGSDTATYVSGSWTIPAVTCPTAPYQNQDAFMVNWVGIDGATNSTVEQLGSGAQCFEGVTYYYVWYEMFPAGTVEEGTLDCQNNNVDCPQPGDRVTASVKVTPGTTGINNYRLTLIDYTRPQESFSTSATCATTVCLDQSAEWIVERPAFDIPAGFQFTPQADYNQTGFSNDNVISDGQYTDIQDFNGGLIYDVSLIDDTGSYYLGCVDQPSAPGSLLETTSATACPNATPGRDGEFGVTWDSSW
jgi:Peptidase A4 family